MLIDQTVTIEPQHLKVLFFKLQQLRELAFEVETETAALLSARQIIDPPWQDRWVQILKQHPGMSWDDAYPGAD